MALPQTAEGWRLINEAAARQIKMAQNHYDRLFVRPLLDLLFTKIKRECPEVFRLRPLRPHTDDMMQMLIDIGCEVPDPVAFDWGKPVVFNWGDAFRTEIVEIRP
jgi:hypothetical protein